MRVHVPVNLNQLRIYEVARSVTHKYTVRLKAHGMGWTEWKRKWEEKSAENLPFLLSFSSCFLPHHDSQLNCVPTILTIPYSVMEQKKGFMFRENGPKKDNERRKRWNRKKRGRVFKTLFQPISADTRL